MRNLLEYPVTHEEILATLGNEKLSIQQQQMVGDMRPLILRHSIKSGVPPIPKKDRSVSHREPGQ